MPANAAPRSTSTVVIRKVFPKATVRTRQMDVFSCEAQHMLKVCDLLIAATDDHSSRMAFNRVSFDTLNTIYDVH